MRVYTVFCSLLLVVPLLSQDLVPAGGKWTYYVSVDKLSGTQHGVFSLTANESVTDRVSSGVPIFGMVCSAAAKSPKWLSSTLYSPVVLGTPLLEKQGAFYRQVVRTRADSKIYTQIWTMLDDFHTLMATKAQTKTALTSMDLRVQFSDAAGGVQVATFSPAGIDQSMLTKTCGDVLR